MSATQEQLEAAPEFEENDEMRLYGGLTEEERKTVQLPNGEEPEQEAPEQSEAFAERDSWSSLAPATVLDERAPSSSALRLRLRLPFEVIERAANAELPSQFRQQGNGDDVCVAFVCAGTRYEYTVRRTSDFQVSRAGDRVRASAPYVSTK